MPRQMRPSFRNQIQQVGAKVMHSPIANDWIMEVWQDPELVRLLEVAEEEVVEVFGVDGMEDMTMPQIMTTINEAVELILHDSVKVLFAKGYAGEMPVSLLPKVSDQGRLWELVAEATQELLYEYLYDQFIEHGLVTR